MARRICPRCGGGGLLPVVYGYPGPGMMEAAERGEIALGGCMISDDDPDRHCPECQVRMYRDGTYRSTEWSTSPDDRLSAVLERSAESLVEAHIQGDGYLVVTQQSLATDGDPLNIEILFEVDSDEAPTAYLMLLIQRFGGGEDLTGWLVRRHIPMWGDGTGSLIRVTTDGGITFYQDEGRTEVPGGDPGTRVLLGTLTDLMGDGTFEGPGDLATWLAGHGVGATGATE